MVWICCWKLRGVRRLWDYLSAKVSTETEHQTQTQTHFPQTKTSSPQYQHPPTKHPLCFFWYMCRKCKCWGRGNAASKSSWIHLTLTLTCKCPKTHTQTKTGPWGKNSLVLSGGGVFLSNPYLNQELSWYTGCLPPVALIHTLKEASAFLMVCLDANRTVHGLSKHEVQDSL